MIQYVGELMLSSSSFPQPPLSLSSSLEGTKVETTCRIDQIDEGESAYMTSSNMSSNSVPLTQYTNCRSYSYKQ